MSKKPVVQTITVTVSAALTVSLLNALAGVLNLNAPAQAQGQNYQEQPTYTFEGDKRMTGSRPPAAGMQEYTWNGDQPTRGDAPGKVVSIRPGSNTKSDSKTATTVVQLVGPDGKLQYKSVKFCGELFSNTNATMSTVVRDKDGGVREYSWVKKRVAEKPKGPECHINYGTKQY